MRPRPRLAAGPLLAALLAAGPALAAAPAPAPREITVCSDPWMPYTGDGAAGADEGYVVVLAKEALRRAGYRVRYVAMPWSRCLADVEAGRWDAVACADATEAKGVRVPEEPVGLSSPAMFTGPGSTWRYTGVASLEEIRLGAVQNYTFTDEVDAWIKAHTGDSKHLFLAAGTDPLRRLFDMLRTGRVDAVVENSVVAEWQARRAGLPPGFLRNAGATGEPVPIYVSFSRAAPDHEQLARAFDAGVRAMRADGSLAALLTRYQVKPWPRPGAARP